MDVVQCDDCGHLYNAAFDQSGADDLYGAFVLTNVPVSPEMVKGVEATAQAILRHAKPKPSVLEIGGGGGSLSMLLAQEACAVDLVEPSRALSADRFAGTGVKYHRSMFPTPMLNGRMFDVAVCRQVVEHIPEPEPFLKALRAQVKDDGFAYIEVPSAEYIHETRSIVDFHYPHVHFYCRPHIEALFARAGFAVFGTIEVKDGHDTAFLLRPCQPYKRALPQGGDGRSFAVELTVRRDRGRKRIARAKGMIGLYGANAYSQALLGVYPDFTNIAAVFDDTPMYKGQQAYGPSQDIIIGQPSADRLAKLDAVIVTAYLHDLTISRKIREFGFKGAIYTVRSDRLAGWGEIPQSLFS
jgi:2-polyprenyl-3-methyl-5-hydroxy-6-metoxy-1,4-benzoquinol methylase